MIYMSKQVAIGQRVKFKGEEWNIAGVGAKTDTHIYLHMAHTHRGVHQKNGFRPVDAPTPQPERVCRRCGAPLTGRARQVYCNSRCFLSRGRTLKPVRASRWRRLRLGN